MSNSFDIPQTLSFMDMIAAEKQKNNTLQNRHTTLENKYKSLKKDYDDFKFKNDLIALKRRPVSIHTQTRISWFNMIDSSSQVEINTQTNTESEQHVIHSSTDTDSDQIDLLSKYDIVSTKSEDKFQHISLQISLNPAELQQSYKRYLKNLPGNDQCCDCGSKNDVLWIDLNFGVVLCVQCAGVHQNLFHNSRIKSLNNIYAADLVIACAMGNNVLNNVLMAVTGKAKLKPKYSMERRYNFIREKYCEKSYVMRTCTNDFDLGNKLEKSIVNADLSELLQVWAEGADLNIMLPSSRFGETALHMAVLREMGTTLHIVDFLIQHMSSQGLNKATNITNIAYFPGKNTALHLTALHDRLECMKLLLRSRADLELENEQGKTALAITKEMGHDACCELIQCSIRGQNLDNIDTNWNFDEMERSRSPHWHSTLEHFIRPRIVTQLVLSMFSSSELTAVDVPHMSSLMAYAKQVESNAYNMAESKTHYYELLELNTYQYQKLLENRLANNRAKSLVNESTFISNETNGMHKSDTSKSLANYKFDRKLVEQVSIVSDIETNKSPKLNLNKSMVSFSFGAKASFGASKHKRLSASYMLLPFSSLREGYDTFESLTQKHKQSSEDGNEQTVIEKMPIEENSREIGENPKDMNLYSEYVPFDQSVSQQVDSELMKCKEIVNANAEEHSEELGQKPQQKNSLSVNTRNERSQTQTESFSMNGFVNEQQQQQQQPEHGIHDLDDILNSNSTNGSENKQEMVSLGKNTSEMQLMAIEFDKMSEENKQDVPPHTLFEANISSLIASVPLAITKPIRLAPVTSNLNSDYTKPVSKDKIPAKKLKMELVASSYDDGYDDDAIMGPNDTTTSISPTNEVILVRPSKTYQSGHVLQKRLKTLQRSETIRQIMTTSLLLATQTSLQSGVSDVNAIPKSVYVERALVSRKRKSNDSTKVRKSANSKPMLSCTNCNFETFHRGHFKIHVEEGCKLADAIKDKNCPVCCGCYTYNQLRYHIQQYTKDTSKATNGHQHFTPEDHKKLLKELSKQKEMEKKEAAQKSKSEPSSQL